jgi:hypothetical protein
MMDVGGVLEYNPTVKQFCAWTPVTRLSNTGVQAYAIVQIVMG